MRTVIPDLLNPSSALRRFEAMAARRDKSNLTALAALSAWSAVALLLAVLIAAETSYVQLTSMRSLWRGVTAEGVIAGVWWSAAVLWLIQGLRARAAPAPRRPMISVGLRLYIACAFTLLGVMETLGRGVSGGLGFFAGIGALSALACAIDLTRTWVRSLLRTVRRTRSLGQPEQLSLPFA